MRLANNDEIVGTRSRWTVSSTEALEAFFPSYPRETTAGAIVAEYGTRAAASILTQLCDVLDDMVAVHEWRRVANAIDVIADAPPQELAARFRIRARASQLTHDPVKRRRQALTTALLVILLRTFPEHRNGSVLGASVELLPDLL